MTTLMTPPTNSSAGPEAIGTPFVAVALPLGLDRAFTYAVPESMRGQVRAGQRLVVPFGKGNRMITGWAVRGVETTDLDEVKAVVEIVDPEPLLTPDLLDLAIWMSRYYVTPIGQVFEAILPAAVKRSAGFKTVQLVVRTEKPESEVDRILSKQRRVLDRMAESAMPLAPRELAAPGRVHRGGHQEPGREGPGADRDPPGRGVRSRPAHRT